MAEPEEPGSVGTGVGVLPASEDKTLVTLVSTASEVGTQVVCSNLLWHLHKAVGGASGGLTSLASCPCVM